MCSRLLSMVVFLSHIIPDLLTPCRQAVSAMAAAVYLARDLITTPAEDMGPQHLVAEIQALAAAHQGATVRVLQGDELLHEVRCRDKHSAPQGQAADVIY